MAQLDELRTDVVSWLLDRTDLEPSVDSFVRLAEADFRNSIRCRSMFVQSRTT